MKAPRSKIQDPDKLQTPSSKVAAFAGIAVWRLELDVSLELGSWSLELFSRFTF
jgi:hypothetical protein